MENYCRLLACQHKGLAIGGLPDWKTTLQSEQDYRHKTECVFITYLRFQWQLNRSHILHRENKDGGDQVGK